MSNTLAASVGTIRKAAALASKDGDLAVTNGWKHTYTYSLDTLLPEPEAGKSLGEVTYELGAVNLSNYYIGRGAEIDGQTLTLPIEAAASDKAEEIGTVSVIIHTGNFEDMTAVIKVRSVNKMIPTGEPTLSATTLTYGQALSAITLSGSMQNNGASVPGTFAWSNPANRPAAQESCAAAWTYAPTGNDKYAIVTGTAAIPEGTEAGAYTVILTGKGNYTGTAMAVFRINPVEQKPLDQRDDAGNKLRLEVESGLSTVPAALADNAQFNTLEKIETALRAKVAEVMTNVEKWIAVFNVTLQYKDGGGVWHNVDPNHFPAEGVTAVWTVPPAVLPTWEA